MNAFERIQTMTTPDAPNFKPAAPPDRPRDIITLGNTEDGRTAYIRPDGTLHIGSTEVLFATTIDGLVDPNYHDQRGLSGEIIRTSRLTLRNKTLLLRHVTSGQSSWWDVDDAGMRAKKHIESGLWTPGKN
jgi:hypothetical protein